MSAVYIVAFSDDSALFSPPFFSLQQSSVKYKTHADEEEEDEDEEGGCWHRSNPLEWRIWAGWEGKSCRMGVVGDVI